jgi:hypothetical protein
LIHRIYPPQHSCIPQRLLQPLSSTRMLLCRSLPAALLTAVRPASRSAFVRAVHVENRLTELGITLPPPGGPKANYQTACFESPTLVRPAQRAAEHPALRRSSRVRRTLHTRESHSSHLRHAHRQTLRFMLAHRPSLSTSQTARVRPRAHRTVSPLSADTALACVSYTCPATCQSSSTARWSPGRSGRAGSPSTRALSCADKYR